MSAAAERIRPPSRALMLLEGRAIPEFGAFLGALPLLSLTPRGDGHPVLVLPGLVTSDISTRPLRSFLKRHGYAVSGGKKTSSGPLALKRELREITIQSEKRERDLLETQVRVQRLDAHIHKLSEQLEHVRVAQQQEEKETLALGHEHRKLAEEHARSSQRLSVARLDLDRLTRDRERATTQKSALEEQLQAKEASRLELEQSLAHAREELTGLQAQLQSANEEHSGLRAELAGLEERQRSATFAKARFDQQVQELTSRQHRLTGELERLGVERARLLADNIELDNHAASFTQRITEVEASVAELHRLETSQRTDFDQISL